MEKHRTLASAKQFLDIQGFKAIPGKSLHFAKFNHKAEIIYSGKNVFVWYGYGK